MTHAAYSQQGFFKEPVQIGFEEQFLEKKLAGSAYVLKNVVIGYVFIPICDFIITCIYKNDTQFYFYEEVNNCIIVLKYMKFQIV